MSPSKIEWTDATWNVVTGCSKVSPGCTHCYAETMSNRLVQIGHSEEKYAGTVKDGRWTGKVNVHPELLKEPLRWRKPRRVFVNSMSDTFHPDVPRDFLQRLWAIMGRAQDHTFQVLTKRPDRMADVLSDPHFQAGIQSWSPIPLPEWPYPNVWVGTSVEDQERADERIPELVRTPAAARFLSCEPLLGPVDLANYLGYMVECPECGLDWEEGEVLLAETRRPVCPICAGDKGQTVRMDNHGQGIHWVIVGGESGPGARPFDVLWAKDIIEQCRDAGVACFVKQLGSRPMLGDVGDPHGWPAEGGPVDWWTGDVTLEDGKGGDMSEWPEDLRVREFPDQAEVVA